MVGRLYTAFYYLKPVFLQEFIKNMSKQLFNHVAFSPNETMSKRGMILQHVYPLQESKTLYVRVFIGNVVLILRKAAPSSLFKTIMHLITKHY